MADIRSMQPGGMAQKTKNSVSRFRSFTSMTAKLLVGAILISTMAGCASTKMPRNIKNLTKIVNEEGYAESSKKKCVVGKTSDGDRQIVVYDEKEYQRYDAKDNEEVNRTKYNKKKKKFEVYFDHSYQDVPEEDKDDE